MKKFALFTLLTVMALGCDSGETPAETAVKNQKDPTELNARTAAGDLDFKNAMFEHYGATVVYGANGLITITYPNEKKLIVEATSDPNTVFIEGSALNEARYRLTYDPDPSKSAYHRLSYTTLRLPVNPCGLHPANETFGQCFVREFEAFCDGFMGCASIATNPIAVSAGITAHCALCT